MSMKSTKEYCDTYLIKTYCDGNLKGTIFAEELYIGVQQEIKMLTTCGFVYFGC